MLDATPAGTETAGRMVGRVHHYPIRVYYAETDAGNVVHHASYFLYAERARTEMLRLNGLDLPKLQDEGMALFAVRQCTADFVAPGRLDDLLEVRSAIVRIGGASVDVAQSIWQGDRELARLRIRLVCIGHSGGASRLPERLRRSMNELMIEAGVE